MGLSFRVEGDATVEPVVERLVLAGFAGRQAEDVEAHIAEMALHGVQGPSVVPAFWPVMPHLVTQAEAIEVFGPDTTPEVEYVLFTSRGTTYVTVGNDQCDLAIERDVGPEKSKNLCQKIVAREAWRLDDVLPHWDDLVLTLACNGAVMQHGRVAGLLRPEALLEKVAHLTAGDHEGRMVFSGTIATSGAYPPGPYRIELSLADPASGRSIVHRVSVAMLMPLY